MQIDFATALTPKAKAIYEWKQNAKFWQKEENQEPMRDRIETMCEIHRVMMSQALESIERELIRYILTDQQYHSFNEHPLNTDNIYDFKMSFGYGQWNAHVAEGFIDFFRSDFEFDFTQFECNVLDQYFDVVMQPLPPS